MWIIVSASLLVVLFLFVLVDQAGFRRGRKSLPGQPTPSSPTGWPFVPSEPVASREVKKRMEQEYQHLVAMFIYESQYFWQVTGVFLLVETVLAALVDHGRRHDLFLQVIGLLIGVISSGVWIVTLKRSKLYTELRMEQAKELEQGLGYSIFRRPENLALGDVVVVGGKCFTIPTWSARPSIREGGIVLAWTFLLFFVLQLSIEVFRTLTLHS